MSITIQSSSVSRESGGPGHRRGALDTRQQRFVNRNVEVGDSKSGFVASMELNPQQARVLTQLLIANGVTDPQKVQEAFLNGH
ncbi:hypothetical protein [Pseudomonas putida]|uniref:hypothetical protein n=1 Tax=Pseudomonas putida TaxID=303 RepID=UPI00081958E8|nr:hypothetical protein [Pseudomonas putida]OCT40370.1 hypothetical protein A6E19_03050 [Pseudomonas putida]